MPLIEAEPRHSTKFLILVGIPSFILAVILSLLVHQYAHIAVKKYSCGSEQAKKQSVVGIAHNADDESDCPPSALAGTASTFALALLSFGFFIHHPRNIFLASMAFVNAASRLPESLTVFIQLLFNQQATYITDESTALKLLNFKDPTASVVIMFFYTLIVFFLTTTTIHDTKIVPRKWLVALILFVALIPLENVLWNVIAPIFS